MDTRQTTATAHVLIVGAGPVGALAALHLARAGVASLVVEARPRPSEFPKMDYVNSRSMELLRAVGLSDAVRATAVPADHPGDFRWTRSLADTASVAWWHLDSPSTLAETWGGPGRPSCEPYVRLRGSVLESTLRDALVRNPLVDLRTGTRVEDLEQDDLEVRVHLRSAAGDEERLRASYVVGCDGGGSTVRRLLGVEMDLQGGQTQHRSYYFSSRDPRLTPEGRVPFVTAVGTGATLVSRDGDHLWSVSGMTDRMPSDHDEALRMVLGADIEVDELINVSEWTGDLAVAQAYRVGRVFLAGDAAHRFYPSGGHGANTGLADGADLAWKLASVLAGWGGPLLLDSYEAERRPVALLNREMCGSLLEVWRRFPRMLAAGATDEQVRGYLAAHAFHVDNTGVHLDQRYPSPPPARATQAAWSWSQPTLMATPGARLPAEQVGDQCTCDLVGPGFSVLEADSGAADHLVSALLGAGVPVRRVSTGPETTARLGSRLVLVRPDGYVAWCGQASPEDLGALVGAVSGQVRRPGDAA